MQVAFSEFVKYVRKAEVGRVVVDGQSFSFTLKSHSALLKQLPGGLDTLLVTARAGDWSGSGAD